MECSSVIMGSMEREKELYGAAYLACVFAGGHDCAKGAYVVITFAHVLAGGFGFVAFFFGFDVFLFVGFVDEVVQYPFFTNENIVMFAALRHLHKVAHFAFQADVGYKPHAGFGVDARQVACVGIAVGVAVLHVE